MIMLPYEFDNAQAGRTLLCCMWGFAFAIGGIVFLLTRDVVPQDILEQRAVNSAWAGVTIVDFFLISFGYLCFRAWSGATGSISGVTINITPDRFLGLRSKAFSGTFPLTDYRCLKIEGEAKYSLRLMHKNAEKHPRPNLDPYAPPNTIRFFEHMFVRLRCVQTDRSHNIILRSGKSRNDILKLANELGRQLNLPVVR